MHHVASEHGAHWLGGGSGSMKEAQWQAQQTNAQKWFFLKKVLQLTLCMLSF